MFEPLTTAGADSTQDEAAKRHLWRFENRVVREDKSNGGCDVWLTRYADPMKTFEVKDSGGAIAEKDARATLLGRAFDYECSLGTAAPEALRLLTGLALGGRFFRHHQDPDLGSWRFGILRLVEKPTSYADLEFDSQINQVILTQDTDAAKKNLWSLNLKEVHADPGAYFRRLYKDVK